MTTYIRVIKLYKSLLYNGSAVVAVTQVITGTIMFCGCFTAANVNVSLYLACHLRDVATLTAVQCCSRSVARWVAFPTGTLQPLFDILKPMVHGPAPPSCCIHPPLKDNSLHALVSLQMAKVLHRLCMYKVSK